MAPSAPRARPRLRHGSRHSGSRQKREPRASIGNGFSNAPGGAVARGQGALVLAPDGATRAVGPPRSRGARPRQRRRAETRHAWRGVRHSVRGLARPNVGGRPAKPPHDDLSPLSAPQRRSFRACTAQLHHSPKPGRHNPLKGGLSNVHPLSSGRLRPPAPAGCWAEYQLVRPRWLFEASEAPRGSRDARSPRRTRCWLP